MRQLLRSAFYLLLPVLLGTGLAKPAAALICTIDDVPAATLLLPYFEVDLSNPNGVTTWFSVNNASPKAVLAHVVIWSDLSVPVLGFDVYLTGYDSGLRSARRHRSRRGWVPRRRRRRRRKQPGERNKHDPPGRRRGRGDVLFSLDGLSPS